VFAVARTTFQISIKRRGAALRAYANGAQVVCASDPVLLRRSDRFMLDRMASCYSAGASGLGEGHAS